MVFQDLRSLISVAHSFSLLLHWLYHMKGVAMDVLSRPLLCSDQIRLDLPFLEVIIKALAGWTPSPKGALDINDNGCI